ncbi:MAG: carboxypeptidase regulatory-like domain-containing protein [Vicinamibacterales bacterium]
MTTTNLSRFTIALASVAVLLLGVPRASAQGAEAALSGSVSDKTGTLLADATVTVKNEKTGEERVVRSNAQGLYRVTKLKPSVYTVRATSGQLAPLEYTGIELAAGLAMSLDLQLNPPGVSETVTVVGSALTLDLSSARMGVNVNEREVQDLPINGRQMSQLYLQAPGAVNTGTGTFSDIRFSGRAVEQNVLRYDGIEGTAIIDASPGNLNGEVPSPFKLQASLENVQEFRVESNSFPAEFGTGTGGQISVVTKSGSNKMHGALFEYYRDDAFDAPNFFDTRAGLPKSKLNQHQYGGSVGGPLAKDRAFFFGSYEGYQLNAGLNFVEAIPSEAAWSRAVPAMLPLRAGFKAPGAVILPGASTNPDYDIAQLQADGTVKENAYSTRLDFKWNSKWSSYVRAFHDQGTNVQPEGVTGRIVDIRANPSNAVFALQGLFGNSTINELKIGYNAADTNIEGIGPTAETKNIALSLTGSVANTGIAGQGSSTGVATPGGLVRANSATNGQAQPYHPFSLSFIDSMTLTRGSHLFKVGGELRFIRMATDRIGGTTYSFANITAFLANQPSTVQYLGDVSAPSVFNNGATGERHTVQNYYVGFAQDEWKVTPAFTLNYGVRYDYYTPMRERDNLQVKFNIDTGVIDPNTTPLFISKKNNLQPRVSGTWALGDKTVLRSGVGMFVGPGQTEDQIQPIESDRISSTLSSGVAFPVDVNLLRANFVNNPNTRSYQPRVYANDYTVPERVYQYTASIQRELPGSITFTGAYVGSQGRNLFLRTVANRITQVVTNPNPANAALVIREFSIVQKDAAGNITGVQNPYAEVDVKTSGGHDAYNAMQLSLARRLSSGLTMNFQYTMAKSYGNTAGSNEAQTAANSADAHHLADFDYDLGYNAFDVRHMYNLSALYALPYGKGRKYGANASAVTNALLGGWDVGAIVNGRSGLPVDVKITRPDVVYRDGSGSYFLNPAADRIAVINTPGGGASRNVRRPDLVPGVDPILYTGSGVAYLNPAAFATPAPGQWGNLERNSIKGPSFKQLDLVLSKRFEVGGGSRVELRWEIFNVLDTVNFANPNGTLPAALPSAALTEANKVQPGQAFTSAAAGTFGSLTSTVGRTVGLGTPRQMQFALRVIF